MTFRRRRHCRAFTLIEMIGVLAVVAILASLLIPKIFEAISNARINKAVVSCHTIKTATLQHYGKFLSLTVTQEFDKVLLSEGFIDKPFAPGIGATEIIQVRSAAGLDATSTCNPQLDCGYDLDGDGQNNIIGARYLVEAVIFDPSEADAQAINDRIEGPNLGEMGNSGQDFKGRVAYNKGAGTNPRILRIYLLHQ